MLFDGMVLNLYVLCNLLLTLPRFAWCFPQSVVVKFYNPAPQ